MKVIFVIVYHLYGFLILTPFYEAVDIMVTDILVITFLPHQFLCLCTITMRCPVISLLDVIAIMEVFLFLVFQPLANMSQIRLFIITAKQRHRLIHKPLKAHEIVVTNFLTLLCYLSKHTQTGILLYLITLDQQLPHHVCRLGDNVLQNLVFFCPNIIPGRSISQVVVLELSTSDGHYISSNQGSINQITFLLHALGFSHHCSQVLLYLPPVQLGLSESFARHSCMSKASLHLFLIVTTLWFPILFHQSSGEVLMRSCILSHKGFHLLARYFREYFIYLVYLSVCVHCLKDYINIVLLFFCSILF